MPEEKSRYFEVLYSGKQQFNLISTEYKEMYQNGEWWGFYQLYLDWEGERYILRELLKWYKPLTGNGVPEWIFKEKTT